jgi:competence CoiA-like predicted nuclease
MWLKFGVAPSGELASIDEVVRGRTQLTCLYCGGSLTAKKGSVKEHHASAHRGNLQAGVTAD